MVNIFFPDDENELCTKLWKNSEKNVRKGEGLTEKNLNENLETPHLATALFSRLPGFHLKTEILNPSHFLHFSHLLVNYIKKYTI